MSTPTETRRLDLEREAIDQVPKQLFRAGGWSAGEEHLVVEDPATAEPLCKVAGAVPRDGRLALDAAAAAQEGWAAIPPRARGELLRSAFDLIHSEADRFALILALESGKTLREAYAEVAYGAEFVRWYAEEAVRPDGDYRLAPGGDKRILTSSQPVGPCLLITPWNFPLAMVTRKVAPALAAGCTAILKPASQTPLTALAFAEVLERCGLPEGVLSVLPTRDSSRLVGPLLKDRRLRKVSFTGSTEVGRQLAEQAAGNLLRTSMELGGNAPFVVFDDADLDRAVNDAEIAKLRNTGQSCTAANRFLVQEGIAEEFSRRLADRLGSLRLGPGTEPRSDVGPLIDAAARKRTERLVAIAVDDGARLLTGGHAPDAPGHFYAPTVLADVAPGALILTEEIFAPIAPISTFATERDALELANATDWGLVAFLHTRDLDRALRIAGGLQVGMVGLNRGTVSEASAPFGGVKQSGLGREGGAEGLREYQEVKYLAVAA